MLKRVISLHQTIQQWMLIKLHMLMMGGITQLSSKTGGG
jgi:hypothetical protein